MAFEPYPGTVGAHIRLTADHLMRSGTFLAGTVMIIYGEGDEFIKLRDIESLQCLAVHKLDEIPHKYITKKELGIV